jgi:hypothetical protein
LFHCYLLDWRQLKHGVVHSSILWPPLGVLRVLMPPGAQG